MKRPNILLPALLTALWQVPSLWAIPQQSATKVACPVEEVSTERLPALNTPRCMHHTLCVGDEVVVIGGHTDGFIPVKTAEYLHHGQWHEIPMTYTHDDGLAVALRSGKVLIAGGFEKDFGVGQTISAEEYVPAEHRFRPVSIMNRRRAKCAAIETDSGRVIVSGNWYHTDDVERYDGKQFFSAMKPVTQQRAHPYMLHIDSADVIMLSSMDPHGRRHDTIWVDRLNGNAFTPPLLRQWHPLYFDLPFPSETGFIGDTRQQLYDYLLPAADSTGQTAIVRVTNGAFTLLDTDYPIPTADSDGRHIIWVTPVISDRHRRQAYMMGVVASDSSTNGPTGVTACHLCVLRISYDHKPARLTLLDAGSHSGIGISITALTSDGDLLLAGGSQDGYFHVFSAVLLLRVASGEAAPAPAAWPWWLLTAALLTGLGAAIALWLHCRRRPKNADDSDITETGVGLLNDTSEGLLNTTEEAGFDELMPRISELMEQQRPYLNSELKAADISTALGVSARTMSNCIKAQQGCSFAQYVNTYRIAYAQQLLRDNPAMKMTAVMLESGFTQESSFFRNFKTITGQTPKEWMARND